MASLNGACANGRYDSIELLSRGLVTCVHKARDKKTGSPVAIKSLRHELSLASLVGQSLAREVEALRLLNGASGLHLLDYAPTASPPYFVTEFIAGVTMRQLFSNSPPSPAQVATLALGVANRLAAVHRLDIVHRDVTPANILISPPPHPAATHAGLASPHPAATHAGLASPLPPGEGSGAIALIGGVRDAGIVALIDFGICYVPSAVAIGSPAPRYAPPSVDDRSPQNDLFALGVILREFGGNALRSIADRLMSTDSTSQFDNATHAASALVDFLCKPINCQHD